MAKVVAEEERKEAQTQQIVRFIVIVCVCVGRESGGPKFNWPDYKTELYLPQGTVVLVRKVNSDMLWSVGKRKPKKLSLARVSGTCTCTCTCTTIPGLQCQQTRHF